MQKTYEINGRQYIQKELSWKKSKKLIDILSKNLTGSKIDIELNFSNIDIEKLSESGVDRDIINIVLNANFTADEIDEIPVSVIMEIIEDFFTLNAKLIEKLKTLSLAKA